MGDSDQIIFFRDKYKIKLNYKYKINILKIYKKLNL